MKTVFMVAEKPSLALSLAKILSNGSANTRRGSNGACSIHEYTGRFRGQNVQFKMTSVCGHVMGVDFQAKFNNWDRVDPADLFWAQIEKKEATPKLRMPYFLAQEARGANYLVLWLDCDKEGENICFEVIDAVRGVMNSSGNDEQTIFRAHFSAITDQDIKNAMANLGSPNKNEAMSVDARQELDLRIGCAFTRFQTKFFQGKYGNLDSTVISYGPCQTPTLGFCVNRHDQIQSFKPEPYWVLQPQIEGPNGNIINIDWERIRIFDKEVAQMFLNMVRAHSTATVISVSKKEKVKQRPLALNTVELMRVASSALGMAPHHAMTIAEKLYTQGYISYPRTETTCYPANFDLLGTLRQQRVSRDWGQFVCALLESGIQKPRKGHDAGDHPPITPLKPSSEAEVGTEAWKLYEYITQHFIATLSLDCRFLQTTVTFSIGTEKFTLVGKEVIDPGYTALMTWQAIPAEENLPQFNTENSCPLTDVKLIERTTNPPDYLTESEVITLMEKHGIGTDASIPVHINNIGVRNYVTVGTGRRLIPTPLGIVLVHGYQKIDPELVQPHMRSAVEEQLNLIAQGKVSFHSVLQHALEIFKLKFQYFVTQITGMDELFEVTFSTLADSGKPLSRCGKCRRFMKFVQAKPCRLHCTHCDETYKLPQNGSIKLYKELRCPLDDFELVLWTTGTKGKCYSVCPYCFNYPPFRDMRKGMGCNECTHPSCVHSVSANGVSSCVECENGVLVLDPTSAPKWKLACNKCSVVMGCFEDAHRVSVTEDDCEKCNSALVTVNFNKAKSPLEIGMTEHTGCVYCDAILAPLTELHHARTKIQRRPAASTVTRGRGRGRGRRRGKPKDKMAQLAAYFV